MLSGEFVTGSEEETVNLGIQLGKMLDLPRTVLLCGDLGTGKTVLTKGIAVGLGLGSPNEVYSPSFTLINEYQGRCKIYHVDLYRLNSDRDFDSVGLDDVLADMAVVIIEWGDKLGYVPANAITIKIEDLGDERRKITIHESNYRGKGRNARPPNRQA
jgi:tRNA threonylcarbamoyladenosine biosynthesis protein TsaE